MTVTIREGFGRPWSEALFPKLGDAIESDPGFRSAFKADPLGAIRERFGAGSLPATGLNVIPRADGGFCFVLPPGEGVLVLNSELEVVPMDEIPDELLEHVSAGNKDCKT